LSSHRKFAHITNPESEEKAHALYDRIQKMFKEVMNVELSGILLVARKKEDNSENETDFVLGIGSLTTQGLVLMLSDFWETMRDKFPVECKLAAILQMQLDSQEEVKTMLKDLLKRGVTSA
jgi:hypothetical protein